MNAPVVSLVMPCYNAMPYLVEAVDSVLGQSFTDWELILVNDGSSDGTEAFLNGLSDTRFIVIHQSNRGPSAARNAALNIARGKYIALADADDLLTRDSLRVRVEFLESNPDCGLVLGIVSTRDAKMQHELARNVPYHRGLMLPKLLKLDERVSYSNYYMFRRALLGGHRFREGIHYVEDHLFLIELAHKSSLVCGYVEHETYWYRRWPKQLTASEGSMAGIQRGFEILAREVSLLASVSTKQKLYLRYKLSRCVLLDWLALRAPLKALAGFLRIWFVGWVKTDETRRGSSQS